MTCPRCGAPISVDAPVCGRCGLARHDSGARGPSGPPGGPGYGPPRAYPPQHPPPYPPHTPPGWGPAAPYGAPGAWRGGPTPIMRPPRPPLREGVVRAAQLAQGIAALACLVHGVFSMTLRRAAYVDVGRGLGGSQSSDQLNGVLLAIASLSSLLAVVLALVVLSRGRGRVAASGTGLALWGLGELVVLVGAALVAGADTRAEAGTAAFAAVLVGLGFVAVAVGHALLAAGLSAPVRDGSPATAAYPGPDPYVGTPLAREPADRPAAGSYQSRSGDT